MVMRAQHLAGSVPQAAELMDSRTRRETLLKLTVTSAKGCPVWGDPSHRSRAFPPEGYLFALPEAKTASLLQGVFAKVPPASSGAQGKVGARFLGCPPGLKNGLMDVGSRLPGSCGD